MAKYRNVGIFIVLMALLVTAIYSLSDNIMSPYVSFDYARKNSSKYVQIIGSFDKSRGVDHGEGFFSFTLVDDKGGAIRAMHRGMKPVNFEHADKIVLLGKYDQKGGTFDADKVLVKCPSKYRKEK
jgi:cytochrome c-type biogenesis protein CcmE